MGCEVKWYDPEHTILIATIAKDTTWADYHAAVDQIVAHAASVSYRVDIIFYDNIGMPAGNPMPHLKSGVNKIIKQPNITMSVIAGSRGSGGFVRVILETLGRSLMGRMMPGPDRPLLFIRTLDEAVKRIHADRTKSQFASSA